jgi:hypothetical protein
LGKFSFFLANFKSGCKVAVIQLLNQRPRIASCQSANKSTRAFQLFIPFLTHVSLLETEQLFRIVWLYLLSVDGQCALKQQCLIKFVMYSFKQVPHRPKAERLSRMPRPRLSMEPDDEAALLQVRAAAAVFVVAELPKQSKRGGREARFVRESSR